MSLNSPFICLHCGILLGPRNIRSVFVKLMRRPKRQSTDWRIRPIWHSTTYFLSNTTNFQTDIDSLKCVYYNQPRRYVFLYLTNTYYLLHDSWLPVRTTRQSSLISPAKSIIRQIAIELANRFFCNGTEQYVVVCTDNDRCMWPASADWFQCTVTADTNQLYRIAEPICPYLKRVTGVCVFFYRKMAVFDIQQTTGERFNGHLYPNWSEFINKHTCFCS